jgi:hypothetical protein
MTETRTRPVQPRWAIAHRPQGCNPAGYLGELRHLPAAHLRRPGDWCDLVVRDAGPGLRWTLVVVDGDTR